MALVPNVDKAPLFLSISAAGQCVNNSSHVYVSYRVCRVTSCVPSTTSPPPTTVTPQYPSTTDLTPTRPHCMHVCMCINANNNKGETFRVGTPYLSSTILVEVPLTASLMTFTTALMELTQLMATTRTRTMNVPQWSTHTSKWSVCRAAAVTGRERTATCRWARGRTLGRATWHFGKAVAVAVAATAAAVWAVWQA